jgi:hypothetical protein
MRVPNFNRLVIVLFSSLIFTSAKPQQISQEDKTAAIQKISKYIAAHYVYPEKGGQIASHLQTVNFKGQFKDATTWKDFNDKVTRELQQFSGDIHLYVRNDAAIVHELKDATGGKDRSHVIHDEKNIASIISESKVMEGNVGYIRLSEINIGKNNVRELYDAMKRIRDTRALIIDLRDNGGGGSDLGAVLESFFLPAGKPVLQFTSRDGNVVTDSTVTWLKENRYDKPVYILVNKKTASAAEAFAFVLRENKRAKIVGENTAGAAFRNEWFAIDDENYLSVSTAVPSLPGEDFTWQDTGIKPDIKVKKGDPLAVALREAARR